MTRFIRFKRSFEIIRYEAQHIDFSGNAFLPSVAFIPLDQYDGISAQPIVSVGERVKEGQLIARGSSGLSANIHSSIPGIVKEFRSVPLPDGKCGLAAIISLEGSFDVLGRKEENFLWKHAPESEIMRVLEDKGVINTFENPIPFASSLRKAIKKGTPIVALRLFDSDPTCQLDSFLSKNLLSIILEGTALIAKCINAVTIVLVHDQKKWQEPSSSEMEKVFQNRKVRILQGGKKYPSGNTRQLFTLIAQENIVCIDPVTAISSYEAVVKNQPVLHRTLVVTGPSIDSPRVLRARIGTPIGDIIEECGGFRSEPGRIVVNGLLKGNAVYDLDTPVTKQTKSLHIMDFDTCPTYTVRECIHCGRCLQVCPVSIDPMRTVIAIRKEQFSLTTLSSVSACLHCGCCAMVCPSRIPLHHIIDEVSGRLKDISHEGKQLHKQRGSNT